MRKTQKHFERIPVEIVKKIANEIPGNSAIEAESATIETRDEATSVHGNWRDLAQRVQTEQDSKKLLELVEELIASIDKEKIRQRIPPMPASGS